MTQPTVKVITDHCTRAGVAEQQAETWAKFLHGLDWDAIKPLVQIARNSKVHVALATGMAARSTSDETVRAALVAHLEAKAEGTQDDA